MPFDNPIQPFIVDPPPEACSEQSVADTPKPDRWNSHLRGTPGITRTLIPLSDTMVLVAIRDILRHQPCRWLRNNIGNATAGCAVGWVAQYTEPTNRPVKWNEQTVRILWRLARALPPSARKGHRTLESAIAAYNDTRSNATLDRWLTRAIGEA